MSTFAETQFKPAVRKQLVRLARLAYAGHLAHLPDRHLARNIRILCPPLTLADDGEVLGAFGVLCVDVLMADTFAAGELPGCAMAGEAEVAGAQLRVDCTLAALVPGELT